MTWYIVRAATRREVTARDSLTDAGFGAYLPMETRWRHFPTKEKVQSPLFVGYLFVPCEAGDIDDILGLDGVHAFLCYLNDAGRSVPMPIPDREIARVMRDEVAGRYDTTRPSRRELKRQERKAKAMRKGEQVKLTDGPFSGFIGRVLEMRQSERAALVEVELFGRVTPVEMDTDHLDAA